jgi:transcriptional regulator of met regulon
MSVNEILEIIYEIQGAADPNHPAADLKERMDEIFERASEVMRKTAYDPD